MNKEYNIDRVDVKTIDSISTNRDKYSIARQCLITDPLDGNSLPIYDTEYSNTARFIKNTKGGIHEIDEVHRVMVPISPISTKVKVSDYGITEDLADAVAKGLANDENSWFYTLLEPTDNEIKFSELEEDLSTYTLILSPEDYKEKSEIYKDKCHKVVEGLADKPSYILLAPEFFGVMPYLISLDVMDYEQYYVFYEFVGMCIMDINSYKRLIN